MPRFNGFHNSCSFRLGRQCWPPKASTSPSKHIIHTVGPIADGEVNDELRKQLASSYRSCLDAAVNAGDSSVAFCCISTGVFGFPAEEAARVAVDTVREWLDEHEAAKKSDTTHSSLIPTVVFNVFLDSDEKIYKELLEL